VADASQRVLDMGHVRPQTVPDRVANPDLVGHEEHRADQRTSGMKGRLLAERLAPPAEPDGALHVGLHEHCHRPPRRAGRRHGLSPKALHAWRARPQGAGGARCAGRGLAIA